LVSADGEACISDFGLSYLVGAITPPSSLISSFRWNAPELHYPEIFGLDECDALRPPSDVWSFGMTVLVSYSPCVIIRHTNRISGADLSQLPVP
jgi:serine/threonine protein kinase